MKSSELSHRASDGKAIHASLWLPEGKAKALLLIAHGLAEHGARYGRLAEILCGSGWVVCAPDHRGHGKTAGEGELGWLADRDGLIRVADDLAELGSSLKAERPGLPLFLLGHSMGSVISEIVCARQGQLFAGCALSGVLIPPDPVTALVLRTLAGLGCLFKGQKSKAVLIDKLTMGEANAPFRPSRTSFDWLSRDEGEVDKYIADPLCGFVVTDGLFRDFGSGFNAVYKRNGCLSSIPKTLPIYIFAGAADPLGGAKGFVGILADKLYSLGLKDIETKLYPGARHETLNETNRDEITADFQAWLESKIGQAK